ncbi:thioredoxin [Paramecium bursaria Chlorella virus NE-JV-1]|nr:thioredoxin [Paramecium bursaria Chlorella virus NE-JV-1]
MNVTHVNSYRQLLSGIENGRRHAILKFSGRRCLPCTTFASRLVDIKDADIDVFDVDLFENKMIGRIFSIKALPTAIFFEDKIPKYHMVGLKEADDFLRIARDVARDNCVFVDWDA